MKIILLGPPGCGKGTVSVFLKQKFRFYHLTTGDLIRQLIKSNTKSGLKLKAILAKGLLISDTLINDIVKTQLVTNNMFDAKVVFDGYPRNLQQAVFLSAFLSVDLVILLETPIVLLQKRIINRRFCPQCQRIYNIVFAPPKVANLCDKDQTQLVQREDDKLDVFEKRYAIFKKNNDALVNYYHQKGKLRLVHSDQDRTLLLSKIQELLGL